MSEQTRRSRRSSLDFEKGSLEQVPVRIGEIKVAGNGSMLLTIGLGSCVAIILWDEGKKLGGLAHAMLPHPGMGHRAAPIGRFATTAVPELIRLMVEHGASPSRLRARLAGGASMFRDVLEGDGLKLGKRNVEAARAALEEAGIPIDGEDVFGTYGRSVFLRTSDGQLLVTSVSNEDVRL